MATYLADRVIVYEGQPSIEATAHAYARHLHLQFTNEHYG